MLSNDFEREKLRVRGSKRGINRNRYCEITCVRESLKVMGL